MRRSPGVFSTVKRAPMLRMAVPLAVGLVIGRWLEPSPLYAIVAWAMTTAAWSMLTLGRLGYARRWWRGAGLVGVWMCFGVAWWCVRGSPHRPGGLAEHATAAQAMHLTVFEPVGASGRVARCWADTDLLFLADSTVAARGRVLLTLMLDSTGRAPVPGEGLVVHAPLEPLSREPDPGGFDQRAWAASFGCAHGCFAPQGAWRVITPSRGSAGFFAGLRKRIAGWLSRSGLPDRERALVKAVLLGIRDELGPDQKNDFARSGTMHVLAVSGSHVAIIYAALVFAFQWAGQRRSWRITRSVFLLVVLWLYAGITGFSPSVLRATITCSVVCLADMTPWRPAPVNSLFTAAFALLIWDPLMLWQLGFQLSFLAVIGIAFFYQPIRWWWVAPGPVMRYFWSLFAVSMAAQVFTTPVVLLWFQAFPTWFLPANLVVVGLVTLGVYGGVALIALHALPVVGPLLGLLMKWLLLALGGSAAFFAALPHSYPAVRIDALQCIALYVVVLAVAAWSFERWRWSRAIALAGLLVLFAGWVWRAQHRHSMERFVVYDDREHLSIAMERGRELVVFCDSIDPWLMRKVELHARSMGAMAVQWEHRRPAVIGSGTASIHFLEMDRDTALILSGAVRLAVLRGKGRARMEAIHRRLAPRDGYVLSPTLSGRARRESAAWCRQRGIPVHDVKADGAYVR